MRAPERETKRALSALLQKFRLKIKIAAYGGVAGVRVILGRSSPTSEIRPSAERQQHFSHFYAYIV